VSLVLVDTTPLELRHQAEHCRRLADSQFDERTRTILRTMAKEFDLQARGMEADKRDARFAIPRGGDSAR
jgi:hypothetical protein